MSRDNARTPLGRYGDLRSGGNLPKPRRSLFPVLMLALWWVALAVCLLITLQKAIGHHAALSCGAC